jgi:hypothetical protein
MRVKLQLVICHDEGQEETVTDVIALNKNQQRIEHLGLTLAEAKHLLSTLQRHLLQQQVHTFLDARSTCPDCGTPLKLKAHGRRSFRTWFGTFQFDSPRLEHCDCTRRKTASFRPLAALLTESVAPELLYMEAKWSSLVSYGMSLDALQDFPHSIAFSGRAYHRSSKASRREDLQVEEPVACWDCSSFDFHSTLAGMLRAPLVGYKVVQMGEPAQKRLLAAFGMMEALHHEQLPVDGVMGLIQHRARHRHLRVLKDRMPARLLLLEPAPDAFPVGGSSRCRDVVDKTAQPLAQCKHAQALALARPVEQGVELRAQGLADRGRERHKFGGQLIDRMAETVTEVCTRKQRPQALDGTVEPIGPDASDPIGRLLLERCALELLVGLGKALSQLLLRGL